MSKSLEAFKKFMEEVSSHKQKLYRLCYDEGIEDEEDDLTPDEAYILFQYKIMALLEDCLNKTIKEIEEKHGKERRKR